MQLPDELLAIVRAVSAVGRPRLVGGCVRDWLLGLEPKDFDLEVAGVDYETLVRSLAPFGEPDLVGRSFGIVKLRRAGVEYDFSLPRRESKTGAGHRGFAVTPDPALSEAEAAARRDFTINAIAYDLLADRVADPHEGRRDLRAGVIRAIGDPAERFREDGLRPLRACRFAAQLGFIVEEATQKAIPGSLDILAMVSAERVRDEILKILGTPIPSAGFALMKSTGILAVVLPELLEGDGVAQGSFHCHDVFEITEPRSAIFFFDRNAVQAERAHLRPKMARE